MQVRKGSSIYELSCRYQDCPTPRKSFHFEWNIDPAPMNPFNLPYQDTYSAKVRFSGQRLKLFRRFLRKNNFLSRGNLQSVSALHNSNEPIWVDLNVEDHRYLYTKCYSYNVKGLARRGLTECDQSFIVQDEKE